MRASANASATSFPCLAFGSVIEHGVYGSGYALTKIVPSGQLRIHRYRYTKFSMEEKMKEIYCKDCGERLSEEDKICPKCGSKKKEYKIEFEEKIELHDQVHGKVKEKVVKKPVEEFKTGDDFYKKLAGVR